MKKEGGGGGGEGREREEGGNEGQRDNVHCKKYYNIIMGKHSFNAQHVLHLSLVLWEDPIFGGGVPCCEEIVPGGHPEG